MSALTSFRGPMALRAAALIGGAALVTATPAHAAIAGFGNFSGFAINQTDNASPPTVSTGAGSIQLTNQRLGESRSIFATTPQNVSTFTASFTYTAVNINQGTTQGVAFVLQNGPSGAAAVGPADGQLGYGGITPSLAIGLQLIGFSPSNTGLYKNGLVNGGATQTVPVDFYTGHPIDVTIGYAGGSFVSESLKDTVTGGTYSATYVLSPALTTLLGGSTAYVGFTASTGGVGSGSDQTISNFNFTNTVPEPASGATLLLTGLVGLRRRRH
ncbi:MAG: hypothetical protein JWM57_682 [Phycisphaerales bacterium]|nr:hypothetical protein [Phycisphaerales bacterium]